MRTISALAALLAVTFNAAGCCPTTAGPTGPLESFSGTVEPASLVIHDYPPPAETTQMRVTVSWTNALADLRLSWIDPTCDPTRQADCRTFAGPIAPLMNATRAIETTATNQGPAAGPRMRFVIHNLTEGASTSYTLTIAPHRAGCT